MTHRSLTPNHARSSALPAFFLLFATLTSSSARSEGVLPPAPPVVDAPPPPPVPVTVYAEDPRSTAPYVERVVARPVYQQAQPVYQQQAAGDPYGFTAWLNGVRARSGLGPVGYDPSLANWASVNNGQQQARGMGHHVMGPARRQNSGMGALGTVQQMWMASPAHQAALLDPSINWIGIAGMGAYWTFNAY